MENSEVKVLFSANKGRRYYIDILNGDDGPVVVITDENNIVVGKLNYNACELVVYPHPDRMDKGELVLTSINTLEEAIDRLPENKHEQSFKFINVGEEFRFDNKKHMRIEPITLDHKVYNAVEIGTQKMKQFGDSYRCYPVMDNDGRCGDTQCDTCFNR